MNPFSRYDPGVGVHLWAATTERPAVDSERTVN